jgi:hypothetical protein
MDDLMLSSSVLWFALAPLLVTILLLVLLLKDHLSY